MTHRVPNSDALALNAAWKRQQAALLTTTQQKPAIEPRIEAPATEKPAVIHQQAPKPAGQTPPECQGCTVHKECRAVLKLWHKRKPRPELARAWCRLIDQNAGQMVCLSGLREVQP